jgi:hypothetical protein
MHSSSIRFLAAFLCAPLIACGGGSAASSNAGGGSKPGASTPSPAPNSSAAPCVISADCPAGAHCDLGQCLQSCNAKEPCGSGLSCTSRARCLPPGQPDSDPTPSTQYSGAITASPTEVHLTDRSPSLDVKLTSTSKGPVSYRVQLDAPHLSIATDRGTFTGTTTLHFPVNVAHLQGHDVPGSVKVFTSLGDVIVDAPIHVGTTGSYSGALRYNAGSISLGDTRVALDVLQDNSGEVSVRIQSQESLLFPSTATGDTMGNGQFSAANGLDFTLVQVIEPSFGAERNHFGRPIGRSVHFQLKPDSESNLSGTFTESIAGLFSEPITTSGTVLLTYQPTTQDPNFLVGTIPALPAAPSDAALEPMDVFPNWSTSGCAAFSTSSSLDLVDSYFAGPLYTAFQSGDKPVTALATACQASLQIASVNAWLSDPTAVQCGLVPELACALVTRAQQTTSDTANAQRAVQLVNEMLAPSLLVAKNDNVNALLNSFTSGIASELAQYNDAMGALAPSATWVLQPAILNYLRGISWDAAQGGASTASWDGPVTSNYPAARALADLFYTSDAIDGERARIGAASASGSQPALANQAQQRAVIAYLEAMSLAAILQQWGSVPSSVGSHISGMLTPLDNGFAALVEGANAFGVPPSYVPFVYSPVNASKGATNFEQMLAISANAVGNEATLESQFVADQRTYDQNLQALNQQLSSVRTQYDLQIQNICGTGFNVDSVSSPEDWGNCGANNAGDVGALGMTVQIAQAKVTSDQDRIQGQKDKIKIDTTALAQANQLEEQDIEFTDSTGSDLAALDFASGIVSAEQSAIQVASNASMLNFGAPLGEATVAFMIGAMQASLSAQKEQLQTAESVHAKQTSSEVAYVNGMAAIQKEEIDLAQMGVDIVQDQLDVLEQEILERNKVEQAKGLFTERQQILASLDSANDPLDDPSYRLITDQLGLQILSARSEAQQELYLAGSALQYEVNQSFDLNGAVLNAGNATGLNELSSCLLNIYNQSHIAYGTPQDYVTTVSVRAMLGITGPRTDAVTAQVLSVGDQFRELLLRNQNLDGHGGVGITFSTDLQEGNGLWASDVCNDRVATVQAQLVGDFLGDNEAQVNVSLNGGSVLRSCDGTGDLVTWSVASGASGGTDVFAVIQAGVNGFGEAQPNTSLFGQSVARAAWKVMIPGASEAPSNGDVDLTKVDDVVLKFDHQALPMQSSPISIDSSCLAQIGGGQ